MSIQTRVVQAQSAIISNLARCEESIATLYSVYSEAFPRFAMFWKALSKKEEQHAVLLKMMLKKLEGGDLFHNIGRFDSAAMASFLDMVSDAIARAKEGTVSPLKGIQTALAIESSILDAHFYDIVTSDAADYRVLAERLSSDTRDHVRAVEGKLREMQSDESKTASA